MRILSEKDVDEILKRITANEIICAEYLKDEDALTHMVDNNMEIAYLVGGLKGMFKIHNTIKKRFYKE
jgi:hypothetical protein